MSNLVSKAAFFSALALGAVPAFTIAATAPAPLTPDAILANSTHYDGQSVTVSGVVKNEQSRTMRFGTVTNYDLCATQCIHVFDRTGGAASDGSTISVTGTFHAQLTRPDNGGGWHGGGGGGYRGGFHSSSGNRNFPTSDVLIIGSFQPGG